jgi:hypothetical protein
MSKFKVGDRVVIGNVAPAWIYYAGVLDTYVGFVGIVKAIANDTIEVLVDGNNWHWPEDSLTHYQAMSTPAATSTEFIINGSSMLFASQGDAENYAMHSGNYTDGCIVEIAQVIRRAVVKRTVSVSLEDSQ